MADINDINAAQTVKIVGADSSGVEQTSVQSNAAGALYTSLRDASSNDVSVSNSTPNLSNYALNVRPLPYEPARYSAATNNFAIATTATDVFRILGSGSKTVRVKRLKVSGRTTSGSPVACVIKVLKYSTANTGGTSVTTTVVPIDSNSAAGTATVNHYTANPTLGTLIGNIDTRSITFQSVGLSPAGELIFDFSENPVVLRGTSQQLSINFNSTSVTGSSICCVVEWDEV
jgi:hypothetical protein